MYVCHRTVEKHGTIYTDGYATDYVQLLQLTYEYTKVQRYVCTKN